jgi:hypothetical protein
MITIDDKTYTEDDLTDLQLMQVERINILRAELTDLEMRAQELSVLINAYGQSLQEGLVTSEEG